MKKIQPWLITLISGTVLVSSILNIISSEKYYLFLLFIPALIILPLTLCYSKANKSDKITYK